MEDGMPMSTLMITNLKKLSDFKGESVDPTLYRQLIGSLMYQVNIRPDICFGMNTLNQLIVKSRHVQWVAAKYVLRYLCGTIDFVLKYVSIGGVTLQGYTNSNWVGSVVDKISTSGCCFNFGSTTISWFSRKQQSVALSSVAVENIAYYNEYGKL